MNIKKEAFDNLYRMFDNQIGQLRYEILRRKIDIKALAEKQRVAKNQMTAFYELKHTLPRGK